MNKKNVGFGTAAIHCGDQRNEHGALSTPIYQTSTFLFDSAEQGGRRFALEEPGYIYSRLGNPTVTVLENKIAALEKGEAGVATSSGMGAISAVFWTLLKAGDHVISDKTLYGCTFSYLNHGLARFGVDVSFVDTADPLTVQKALRKNTRILYLETPANPTLKIIDIRETAKIVHAYNPEIKVVVDNTFATPWCQRPLELGADIVVHSATKYLNGHGDVIAGLIVAGRELADSFRLVGIKDMNGSVIGPAEAWLIIRGMKTLEVRMQKHCENARKVAAWLESHPKIEKVYYPGLERHENYGIACRQMTDTGGILAFELKGGYEAGIALLNSLRLCALAVSLGDTETLIQHPASMTHSPYTREERLEAGITDGLTRLSVGLENEEDILADLEQGLDKVPD
ncbi:MAG: methionine gamma-lyase [Fusobacteriaceae bacterium]|nr:methionine gamma-lyase [Fusobacteriaceae bacterium]